MNYLKVYWDESTGNELTDSWGKSIFYFETDDSFNALRQVQVFDNKKALKYDTEYIDDKNGGLSEVPIIEKDIEAIRIEENEFLKIWNINKYEKFPEIVITDDILWGQPRIKGKRISVGDIICSVDMNQNLNFALDDYKLSMQEIRQALHYCKIRQCIEDNPKKFCHNCTLRVEQEKTIIEEEKENWKRAKKLMNKYFE